ncbi:MAG: hypothetical protein HY326_10445 [Chloroflexi bacterium]|nr:hypothetical protein [Chloroflexota bacterium]
MQTILFLDNWMIERQDCLERAWGHPQFVKEVFTDLHPEALGYGGYDSIFFDERLGQYVMYLAVYPPEADPGTFVLRLQTDDPYNWPAPPYDRTANPIWKGFQDVVLDEKGERFWAIYTRSLEGTPFAERGYLNTSYNPNRQIKNSIFGFSADGLRFTLDHEHPWQNSRSDTWCGWVWNARAGLFEIFTRPVHVDRRIAVVTTQDWQHFTSPVTVLQPDALDRPGTEFYSMPCKPYEDMFIGMVHVFSTDTFEQRRVKMAGRMETQLTYSYNGFNWYRGPRDAFIPTRDFGLQGGGQVYGMELLRTGEDKLLIYTNGSFGEHAAYGDMQKAGMDTRGSFNLLLYEMRLDGFCSMKTWGKDGLLRTKTIIPKSGKLQLNLRTTNHTAVRVQLLDGNTGEPIPG